MPPKLTIREESFFVKKNKSRKNENELYENTLIVIITLYAFCLSV